MNPKKSFWLWLALVMSKLILIIVTGKFVAVLMNYYMDFTFCLIITVVFLIYLFIMYQFWEEAVRE